MASSVSYFFIVMNQGKDTMDMNNDVFYQTDFRCRPEAGQSTT